MSSEWFGTYDVDSFLTFVHYPMVKNLYTMIILHQIIKIRQKNTHTHKNTQGSPTINTTLFTPTKTKINNKQQPLIYTALLGGGSRGTVSLPAEEKGSEVLPRHHEMGDTRRLRQKIRQFRQQRRQQQQHRRSCRRRWYWVLRVSPGRVQFAPSPRGTYDHTQPQHITT